MTTKITKKPFWLWRKLKDYYNKLVQTIYKEYFLYYGLTNKNSVLSQNETRWAIFARAWRTLFGVAILIYGGKNRRER